MPELDKGWDAGFSEGYDCGWQDAMDHVIAEVRGALALGHARAEWLASARANGCWPRPLDAEAPE